MTRKNQKVIGELIWKAEWASLDGRWNTIVEGPWPEVYPVLLEWRADNLADDGTPIYETHMTLKEDK